MLRPDPASLNYLAIAAAGLAAFFLGALWYTALFGKTWQRLNGYSADDVKAMQARRPVPVFFAGLIVCYFAAAAALALLVQGLNLTSPGAGALLGAIAWVVVAAFAMTGHLSSPKPLGVYAIDAGFGLVFLPIMGATLAAWH